MAVYWLSARDSPDENVVQPITPPTLSLLQSPLMKQDCAQGVRLACSSVEPSVYALVVLGGGLLLGRGGAGVGVRAMGEGRPCLHDQVRSSVDDVDRWLTK